MDAIKIANVLLRKAKAKDINDLTNLKLQKMLYLLYEDYAIKKKEALFNNPILAWRHGPVVREVYDKYKGNGSKVIDKFNEVETVDNNLEMMIDEIIEKYGKKSAWELVEITHKKNGPWHKTVERNREKIEIDLILNGH